jgi:hypothetical protein
MADFRKWSPAAALAVLMFGAVSANAQQGPAFSCVGNAGVPPIVRAEGITELVGDLVLNCSGGTPTAAGAPVPQVNFQIFLNTNVTSRLVADPWSEALLMIDEPTNAAQRYCSQNGGCAATGVGAAALGSDGQADGIDYDDPAGTVANVHQGRQSGANSIVWLGVPIDPPGSNATRIIRVTNVRANANQLGVSSTLIPTQIIMFVSATGTTSIPINNPQQTVAFIQPGLSFSIRQVFANYLQCVSFNRSAATDSTAALASGQGHGTVVRFAEGFASAFKRRNTAAFTNADTAPTPIRQNDPGAIYNSESGFYNPTPNVVTGSANGLAAAGLADHGTRLMARFANIPAGIALYASVYPVTSATSGCAAGFSACITGANTSTTSASGVIQARLVTTDANGAGAFSATVATQTATPAHAPVALNNGAGTAVWEVVNADPLRTETFEFGVAAAYVANTSNNLPGLGTATVAGSFAPLSSVTTASASAPIPRFADTSAARTMFTVSACTTNLLFVFLTNQAGFDSGIAISNTSVDPFGTAPQSGPCTLNYYGSTTGGGAAPARQTSAVVPAGGQLTAVLSTGGNLGIAATPGFQGYMIAQCQFQYAHGFAFISDVGANRVSEAYLALILDSALPARTLFSSEILGH